MLTRVQKWGNSQGLRFSKAILNEARIEVGDTVNVSARKGRIVVEPATRVRGKYALQALLARMPKDYVADEVEWGQPPGKEIW